MRQRRRTGSGNPAFNPKRRLRAWAGEPADIAFGATLAAKVRYVGHPAHKRNPGDFELDPPAAPRPNATLCDDARVFTRLEAQALLAEGARIGLVDSRNQGAFPFLIWAVGGDGVVFEAQLENEATGAYHGYPMPLSDPFRRAILQAARSR